MGIRFQTGVLKGALSPLPCGNADYMFLTFCREWQGLLSCMRDPSSLEAAGCIGFTSSIMTTVITDGPNIPTTGSYTLPFWRKVDERTDVVRRIKPKGIDEILRLTPFDKHEWFLTRATVHNLLNAGHGVSAYQADPAFGRATYVNGPLAGMAWGKLLDNLQNTKFDSATFLGELPETVRWIASSAKDMMDAYRAIRQGRWTKYLPTREIRANRKFRKYVRVRGPRYRVFTFKRRDGSQYSARLSLDGKLSKRYLEWRFAVQPLVSEAGNLLDAYYEQAINPIIASAQGSASHTVPLLGSYQKGHRREYVRARAYYSITTSAKALQKWGGINIVHTLWNLTPLSFMVDRFIPVGQFLGNLDAEMGVEWKSFYTMMRYRFELQTEPPKTANQRNTVSTCYGSGYIRRLTKSTGADLAFSMQRADFRTALDLLALTRTIGESLLKRK